jgi:5'-deoxynucleotidase YfbR-like HD superfamily hydrolase
LSERTAKTWNWNAQRYKKAVHKAMENSFSILEEKVHKAVRLIQDLRAENSQLLQQNDELKGRYQALQEDNQRMSHELERSQAAAATIEQFEEKRRIIEEKVGGLLEKLEQIG